MSITMTSPLIGMYSNVSNDMVILGNMIFLQCFYFQLMGKAHRAPEAGEETSGDTKDVT